MEGTSTLSFTSPTIRPINKGVVRRICSGQVILDLPSAVKELVENSLDAGATSIEISLKEYGEESFQVIDNGCGISPPNFKVLALKHHTSKIAGFPDLQSLTTFGFRGEALSSLCALGDLNVETRTKNELVATHLTFDHSGLLKEERKTARQVGTTVTVNKLFSNLPVRSKEFHRNIRKEYGKLISLLNAYALIAKGVRFVCSNTTGKNAKSVVLKTQGTGSLKDNIITVFGMNTFACLEPFNVRISDNCWVDGFLSKSGYGSGRNLGDRQFFFVNGRPVDMPKVSKLVNELYRGANSRQYPITIMDFVVPTMHCDVNVTPDKRKIFFSDEISILQSLREALDKIYSPSHASYSVNKFEELSEGVINISNLSSKYGKSHLSLKEFSPDVNGNKDEICSEEPHADQLATVKEGIKGFPVVEVIDDCDQTSERKNYETMQAGGFSGSYSKKHTSHLNSVINNHPTPLVSRAIKECTHEDKNTLNHSSIVQSSLAKFVAVTKRKHKDISTTLSEVPLLRNGPIQCQSRKTNSEMCTVLSETSVNCNVDDDFDTVNRNEPKLSNCFQADHTYNETDILLAFRSNITTGQHGKELEPQEKVLPAATSTVTASSRIVLNNVLDGPSETVSQLRSSYKLKFDLKDLHTRKLQRLSRLQSCNDDSCGRMKIKGCYAAATLDLSQPLNEEGKVKALAAATNELERLFKKEDFGQMQVIGQFNLGFIIGKIDKDLFIVDQHAADEKYNFERLSQSTILNQQPLLRPLQMELSPEEEIVISMHMDTIRKNGFSLDEDVHAPPGHRYRLKSVPFSKNITFGVADLKELISILADSHGECSMISSYRMDSSDSVCPSRVRAMLASRACRSSVMIGDPLGRNEMQKIIEHLADLRSPWNCPHGRPTMRHLVDLTTVHKRSEDDCDAAL